MSTSRADLLVKLAEQLIVVANEVSATVPIVSALARLEQPDVPPPPPVLPVVTISGNLIELSEDNPSTTITATLDKAAETDVSVGLGYRGVEHMSSDPLTIPAGSLSAATSIKVWNIPDADAQLSVSIINVFGGATFDPNASLNYLVKAKKPPEPLLVTLSTDSSALTLPESGGAVKITASISHALPEDFDVPLQFAGTATSDLDYVCPRSITIPAGQTEATVGLESLNDTIVEGEETIQVQVVPSDKYVLIGSSEVMLRLIDDDVEPIRLSLSTSRTELLENGGILTLTLTASRPVGDDGLIAQLVFEGTAERDVDYDAESVIEINPGETTGFINVTADIDEVVEGSESIVVRLKQSDEYEIAIGSVVITLVDDDKPPPEVKPALMLPPEEYVDRITPAVWALVIKYAEVPDPATGTLSDIRMADRCLCAAAIARCGLLPIGKYKLTNTMQYGVVAIKSLLAMCQKPINTAGSHYDYTHVHPVALGYSWLREFMLDDERKTVVARIAEALEATIGGKLALDKFWSGYNLDAGCGMMLAQAIQGETDKDYVKAWHDCWWSGNLYNMEYKATWQPDGGSREGWPYLADQAALAFCRAAYDSGTGDTTSLDLAWFNRIPLLLLHQVMQVPQFSTTGKLTGYRPFPVPNYEYGGRYLWQPGLAYLLAAGTGNHDKTIAALSAYLLSRWPYAQTTGCEELIFKCLIGDPRVKPQSPEELGLPLDYTTRVTGYHYDRSDWRDDDKTIRVYFGCGEALVRNEPRGDVMVMVGGFPLISARTGIYQHDYSGPERMNVILLWDTKAKAFLQRLGGTQIPSRKQTNTFRQDGTKFIAELQGLYPGKASLIRRTFERQGNVITLLDEVQCADGIVPVITWNTPLEPVVGDGVTLSNGIATALMTFDAKPDILVRGGEADGLYSLQFDGSLHAGEIDSAWKAATRAEQIRAGGFYTVYVTPPLVDGVYRLETRIEVK